MNLSRRRFVANVSAAATLAAAGSFRGLLARGAPAPAATIITVAGPIDPAQLGTTLPHEHVLVDFVGADQVSPDRYDAEQVVVAILPHLTRLRDAGCRTFVDCTPAFLGRDPRLLLRLSKESGLHVLTNTGYYGARQNKFLPPHALTETEDQLAARWEAEFRDGIDGTGVRPGFMKIGVDAGPLSDVHRRLVRAAARTHRATGLTIAVHTGDGRAAMGQLDVLSEEKVRPDAWVWVHANSERDRTLHVKAARSGGWVEFDGVAEATVPQHVELVLEMRRHDLLGRVLISQDAGWYHVGEPGGGKVRGYDLLLRRFLPALRKAGLSDDEVNRLVVDNPREAFTVRTRMEG